MTVGPIPVPDGGFGAPRRMSTNNRILVMIGLTVVGSLGWAALRDPAPRAFYHRKRAEGKRHNATLICLARRCCDVILAILRTGQAARAARHAELADVA